MSFGERIKYIRGNLTQTAFSDLMGVHRNTVRGWEEGTAAPGREILVRFMELFKVNLNWLFSGKGEPFLGDQGLTDEPAAGTGQLSSRVVVIHRGRK